MISGLVPSHETFRSNFGSYSRQDFLLVPSEIGALQQNVNEHDFYSVVAMVFSVVYNQTTVSVKVRSDIEGTTQNGRYHNLLKPDFKGRNLVRGSCVITLN